MTPETHPGYMSLPGVNAAVVNEAVVITQSESPLHSVDYFISFTAVKNNPPLSHSSKKHLNLKIY